MKKIIAGLLGVFFLFGAAQVILAETTLVINSFGGAYEKAHLELVIKPFEQKYNCKIKIITAYSADALARLRAQKNKPQLDIVHFSGGQEAIAAKEDLLVPIKPEQLSNYEDMYPFAVEGIEQGRGPVYSIAAFGILYNTDKVSPAPTGWKDLSRKELCGRILLTDISNTYGLLGLLMLNKTQGGSLDDIKPGLEAVKKLLDCSTIISKSPEIQQNFAQGNAWIAPYAQDYTHTLTKAGLPIKFLLPEEGTPAVFITVNAVAGRPNTDLAIKFIDFSIRAEAQAGWAAALRYSPTNRATKLSPELAEQVIYGKENIDKLVKFDPITINANRAAWTDEWNRTIAR
jgi:putative spermidine/putrescine transport system substrate-binding protein